MVTPPDFESGAVRHCEFDSRLSCQIMNEQEEFNFKQAIANVRLESNALTDEHIELLRKVIENEMTIDEALSELKNICAC